MLTYIPAFETYMSLEHVKLKYGIPLVTDIYGIDAVLFIFILLYIHDEFYNQVRKEQLYEERSFEYPLARIKKKK